MTHFDLGRGERRPLSAVVRFTPLQQDVMKLLALALMVFDHANRALGLDSSTLLLLGRSAFPLFALVWGANLARRPVRQAQATRLWGWALLAQSGCWLVMRPDGFTLYEPNILFLFAVVTQALAMAHWPVRQGSPNGGMGGALLLALWGYYLATPGTYGVDGLLLLLASYGLCVTLPPTVSEAGWLRGLAIVSWPILTLRLNAGLGHSMMLSGLLLPTLLIAGALAVVAISPLDPPVPSVDAGVFPAGLCGPSAGAGPGCWVGRMRYLTAPVQTALLSLDLAMSACTAGFTAAAAFGKVGKIWFLLVVHAGRWTGWSLAPDASTPELRVIFGRTQRKLRGRKQARCLRELYLMFAQDQSPLPTLSAGSGD